jgi:hypothetical protein
VGELWFLKRARQADDSRVAEAEKEAAQALARAAEADRARAELEVKLQPRMTDQRQFDLIQSLRGKLDQITIAYETDAETVWFANSLRDAFWAAGLRVAQYPRASEVHSFGMFVYDPGMKGAKLSEIGEVLVDIFRGTGTVLAVIGALPTDVPASVELVIMIKVCRVAISKKQISTLPKDERVLFY